MLHESPETPLGACVATVDPIETTEEAIDKSATSAAAAFRINPQAL
jgi:hypothetical protein